MADTACARCGRDFKFPSRLQRHLQRKTPCAPIVETSELPATEQTKPYGCKFCGHRFTQKSNMYTHMKKSCKVASTPEGVQILYQHVLKKEAARADQAEAEAALLREQVKTLQQHGSLVGIGTQVNAETAIGTQINHQKNITNVTNHITINVFGKENLSHIDSSRIKQLLDKVLLLHSDPEKGANLTFVEAGILIFSDKEHPENITCFLPNSKQTKVLVYKEGGWMPMPLSVVAPIIGQRICDLIFDLQPFTEDHSRYAMLLRALADNEERLKLGTAMRDVLIRNKHLLASLAAATGVPPPAMATSSQAECLTIEEQPADAVARELQAM